MTSISREVTAAVVFILSTATVGLALTQFKSQAIGHLIESCPSAIAGFVIGLGSLGFEPGVMSALTDCGVGAAIYLIIPGIGVGWLLMKFVLKV